jgi:MFS transporter, PPP family, 3-phenylpropionic acid transporter
MGALYFVFYAGIACWGPYIVLYYQRLGLTGTQIGLLNAITPLGMAFLAPLWGYAADSRSAHRLILRVALLTTAAVALLLAVAPGFWQVLPLILVLALVGSTASPLIDSYGVTISAQRGLGFGQLRLWGSLGYTATVWLVGLAMGGVVSRLFLLCYAVTLVLSSVATIGLPAQRGRSGQNRWQGAAEVVRRPDMRTLLLAIFLLSASTQPVFALFGIYIEAIGGTTTQLGVASAAAAISEFPVMFLGSRLIKRFGSRRLFVVALCFYCVRLLLYTVAPGPNAVVAVQFLHGCSFGVYLMASVSLVQEIVGPQLVATAQGLLASAMAFGQMGGSLASGILLDQIGIIAIYRVSVAVTALALLVFVVGMRRYGGAVGAVAENRV